MSRRRQRARGEAAGIEQLPWQEVSNPYSPLEVLSADQVETLIESALEVLEQRGMRFLDDNSREILKRAGATAEDDDDKAMLRLDRGMVRELTALAPSKFSYEPEILIATCALAAITWSLPRLVARPFAVTSSMGDAREPIRKCAISCAWSQSLNIIHQGGWWLF